METRKFMFSPSIRYARSHSNKLTALHPSTQIHPAITVAKMVKKVTTNAGVFCPVVGSLFESPTGAVITVESFTGKTAFTGSALHAGRDNQSKPRRCVPIANLIRHLFFEGRQSKDTPSLKRLTVAEW
jgi:hypothetical protein